MSVSVHRLSFHNFFSTFPKTLRQLSHRVDSLTLSSLWYNGYRLRLGHVGLNDYLHRFNMNDSNLCQQCKTPETIDHFLLNCQKYNVERANLIRQLRKK